MTDPIVMMDEWTAWQRVVALLEERGIVVNDDHVLIRTIELWAETLVRLRSEVDEETRGRLLDEAIYKLNAVL